jgi:tRNA threonylcarbamoyladenosine biosynthesis protein TsaB
MMKKRGVNLKILAIESASITASVALLEDKRLLAEYTVNYKKTHSQTLLPMIDEIVAMTDTDLNTIDAIAVSGGPGSFTGLRIGSATAKGLGLALNKPLLHVPTLDAMAYQCEGIQGLICPIMDARRENVFTGIYSFSETFEIHKPQEHNNIHTLMEELNQMGQQVTFLGDGCEVYREIIQQEAAVPVKFAPVYANQPRAAAVAALGAVYYQEGKLQTATEHVPDYLRVSQAEKQLQEKITH